MSYSNSYTNSLGATSEGIVNTTEPWIEQVQLSIVKVNTIEKYGYLKDSIAFCHCSIEKSNAE